MWESRCLCCAARAVDHACLCLHQTTDSLGACLERVVRFLVDNGAQLIIAAVLKRPLFNLSNLSKTKGRMSDRPLPNNGRLLWIDLEVRLSLHVSALAYV